MREHSWPLVRKDLLKEFGQWCDMLSWWVVKDE